MLFLITDTYAQSFVDGTGFGGTETGYGFRLHSLESNPGNFSTGDDWEISAVFSALFSTDPSTSIKRLAIGKKFGVHSFYARYTPGLSAGFVLDSGIDIVAEDTVLLENGLETAIEYKESFGFGYGIDITENAAAGFSFRFFEQEFIEEKPVGVYTDTISYIITESEQTKEQLWRGDLGITFCPVDMLRLSLFSINLFTAGNNEEGELQEQYGLKYKRGAGLGIDFTPEEALRFALRFETGGSFGAGGEAYFDAFGGKIGGGLQALHDKYQEPFIAAVSPWVRWSNEFMSVTLAGMVYTEDRTGSFPVELFRQEGIHNIAHNRYSSSNINLITNLALTFGNEKRFVLLDVEVLHTIYPTITDSYIDRPFAKGKAVNTSDEPVTLFPVSYIESINEGEIQSPSVTVAPGDTAQLLFYTIIDKRGLQIDKGIIGRADFYVGTENPGSDEQLQKPVLITTMNSWDSNVSHLRYFVQSGIEDVQPIVKKLLSQNKDELDTLNSSAATLRKAKIIFEYFAADMLYAADPRASSEYVQFPAQTLDLKGGDCDDFSVLFAALFESIGIETAFVDYRSDEQVRHVNILINTGLLPSEAPLITVNDRKYFIRKDAGGIDRVWIPLETTLFSSFDDAWNRGTEIFNEAAIDEYGLAKGTVEIFDIF